MQTTTSPKVFISYAHQSEDKSGNKSDQHQRRVLAFANQLRSDSVDVNIPKPPQDAYFRAITALAEQGTLAKECNCLSNKLTQCWKRCESPAEIEHLEVVWV